MTRSIDVDSIADALVRNAAPTLTGIKPASLFTFPGRFVGGARERAAVLSRREAFLNALDACRAELAGSGVLIRVLVWRHCGALVYVYRPRSLARYLADPRAAMPLAGEGYRVNDLDACLDLLAERLEARGKFTVAAHDAEHDCPCTARSCRARFPHEIGFFLGYPYADVAGFMEHEGRDFILMGQWKVYADPAGALALFERIKTCTERCCEQRARGAGLAELAACAA